MNSVAFAARPTACSRSRKALDNTRLCIAPRAVRTTGRLQMPLRSRGGSAQDVGPTARLRHSAQINGRQLQGATAGDDLHRVSVDLSEDCTQRFVTRHNFLKTVSQSLAGK